MTGIACNTKIEMKERIQNNTLELSIFRILQETLLNITRHASATSVDVDIKLKDGNIFLEIKDNGIGITEEQVKSGKSFGIIGMRERVSALGGKMTISGSRNKGTLITVFIPIKTNEVNF